MPYICRYCKKANTSFLCDCQNKKNSEDLWDKKEREKKRRNNNE